MQMFERVMREHDVHAIVAEGKPVLVEVQRDVGVSGHVDVDPAGNESLAGADVELQSRVLGLQDGHAGRPSFAVACSARSAARTAAKRSSPARLVHSYGSLR